MNARKIFGPCNHFPFYNIAVGPLLLDNTKPRAAPVK